MTEQPDNPFSQLYADLTSDIQAQAHRIDGAFRKTHEGMPASEIVDAAEHAFADIGLHLSDEQLEAYSAAVSQKRAFDFVFAPSDET